MDIVDPRIDPSLVPPGSKAVVIAEHQDEYRDLPSVRTPDGKVITRWSLTDDERAAVLRGEDVFVTILSGFRCDHCGTLSFMINPLFVTIGTVDWTKQAQ